MWQFDFSGEYRKSTSPDPAADLVGTEFLAGSKLHIGESAKSDRLEGSLP
jgi:hypothetical protein